MLYPLSYRGFVYTVRVTRLCESERCNDVTFHVTKLFNNLKPTEEK